jgi:hypothetical protein
MMARPLPSEGEKNDCHGSGSANCFSLKTRDISIPGTQYLAAGQRRRNRRAIDRMSRRRYTGPVPTLAQLRASSCWVWVCCDRFGCTHSGPWPYAPLIIRWGQEASSDMLRQRARCSRCGYLGATLRHPSWSGDIHAGDSPFPAERIRFTAV